ncbi:MAG: phenylalanine--tRNA ligase subunit beta [Archaeoglobaceae archaeon]|nr:phenylalanine--tRNA ligase subunit beta [Archaeoglobaceae archaeon]MCX8152609.1 phenylalanine--tRNA ligase subunit beta [Archaeoglobaceae archaeon]MDW8014109.1 phenylalanine--tRNA ligase subunit beta [Archaeoglobaceae archaeon]
MPVIRLYWRELEELVGVKRDVILKRISMLGCDVERVYEDYIDVEFFPNRPDLYSIEGVARALRGFLEIEKGLKDYKKSVKVDETKWKIFVESSVLDVRPRIAGCVAKNVKMSDEFIRSLISLQEDLHWTIGRNRRKMAIGIHDLSKISFPLIYKAVDSKFSFVPLDFNFKMTVEEILKDHPKGKAFSFILEGKEKFPMIIDSEGDAISFPPIINSEKTRVTEKTKDLFIDVTGFDENVDRALNIIACMLIDRGAEIESVVVHSSRFEVFPKLEAKVIEIERDEIYSLLGFKLNDEEIKDSLEKMRFGCEIGEKIKVFVPAYRVDVMHAWDVIEDIAIGLGYDKIIPEYPKTEGVASPHPWNEVKDLVKEVMIGLGFVEVLTFTLSNEKEMYVNMKRKAKPWENYVPLMHPLTSDHTLVRTSILPKLLGVLNFNKHHEVPQKIFEVGDVVRAMKNELHLAACITHPRTNFSEIRGYVQALMRDLGIPWDVKESEDEAFLEGRRADIIVNKEVVGTFGEINPEVLENFKIEMPVTAFEIDLSKIFDLGEIL